MSKDKEIWLIKTGKGYFIPFQDSDYEIAQRIPAGEENCFTYKHVRLPSFHRKYFALIKLAYENQDHYKDQYVFRKVLEMRAGYHELVITEKGKELYLPKSIAYSEIDQADFEKLYDGVYAEIEKMLGLVSEEDRQYFQNELAQFA